MTMQNYMYLVAMLIRKPFELRNTHFSLGLAILLSFFLYTDIVCERNK